MTIFILFYFKEKYLARDVAFFVFRDLKYHNSFMLINKKLKKFYKLKKLLHFVCISEKIKTLHHS